MMMLHWVRQGCLCVVQSMLCGGGSFKGSKGHMALQLCLDCLKLIVFNDARCSLP